MDEHVVLGDVGTCSVTGKRQYVNKSRAKQIAKRVDRSLRPYRCEDCAYWHLGHLGGYSREWHRQRREVI